MTCLVTWNCNMAFREKCSQIVEHDPDVLVIQECESPAVAGDWSEFSDWRWIGANEHKGLGIFARNGLSLGSPKLVGRGGRFTLPVRIDGAPNVLAVWAMNDEEQPKNRYIGQVYSAVREYADFLNGEVIVAGDFNWNVQWDESPKSTLVGDFADTRGALARCGLESAYHGSTNADFGTESQKTFFMHKQPERGYHTDYVFVPERAPDSTYNCTVGEYETWIEASDHMPIFVEW